jgi:hypothetical protein
LLKAALLRTHLLKSKYDQPLRDKVYFHNLSYFDRVFILNILDSLPNCQLFIVRHEGRFINLKLNYGGYASLLSFGVGG